MKQPVSRRHALLAGAASLALPSLARGQAMKPSTRPAGRQGDGFYRTIAGGMEVTLVTDGTFAMAPLYPSYGGNQPEQVVLDAARDYHVDADVHAHVHCLLVRSPDGLVLVDAGCGPLFGEGAGRLIDCLASAGVAPEDIDAVLLTHAHIDHVGGLLSGLPEPGGRLTFPNATVHVTDAERDFWLKTPPSVPDELKIFVTVAQNALGGVGDKLASMAPGTSPAKGIEVVALPGHTPGHVGLRIGTGDDALLYVADTMIFLPLVAAYPAWHIGFDSDPAQGAATRERLFATLADESTRIAGPHVPFPGFGHLRRREAGSYEFLPESWRWTPRVAG